MEESTLGKAQQQFNIERSEFITQHQSTLDYTKTDAAEEMLVIPKAMGLQRLAINTLVMNDEPPAPLSHPRL